MADNPAAVVDLIVQGATASRTARAIGYQLDGGSAAVQGVSLGHHPGTALRYL